MFYRTINSKGIAEFTDRGSRFIAMVFPISSIQDFKEQLQLIKKEHPKAAHHCFAYRIGTDGNTFRVSDDGEPSGTAGRPILGQIDSKELTNIAIVVVRYFGGTLLGVPGLINAYKSASSMALQVTPVVQQPILVNYRLQFDYHQQHEVMTLLKRFKAVIMKQELQLFCWIEAGFPKSMENEMLNLVTDIKGLTIEKINA